jgi:hypothetical protein
MSKDGRFMPRASAALLFFLSLGGCATSTPMDARAEMPGNAKRGDYPDLGDLPSDPANPAMTAEEVSKLKKELIDARGRQAPPPKAKADPTHKEITKP